jgi:hypothetical protein
MGWFRPVHAKTIGSREVRALLVARKQLLSKLMDLDGEGEDDRGLTTSDTKTGSLKTQGQTVRSSSR